MATVTVIIGLCGSGKSRVANRIVGATLFDEGVAPGWPNCRPFHEALAAGKDCAIVEIAYCVEAKRVKFVNEILTKYPGTTFNWICLENNPAVANTNCREDPARTMEQIEGNIAQNARMTAVYTYPPGAVVLKIISNSDEPLKSVREE